MDEYFKCLTSGTIYPLSKKIVGCPEHPGPYNDLIVENAKPKRTTVNGEFTPCLYLQNFARKHGFNKLILKDESKNPTGSFKDRGCAVLMEYLKKWRVKEIVVVSCGNDAIATAAFAQKAGIKCHCVVPEGVNGSKAKLINLYGAQLVVYPANYETAFKDWTETDSIYNATGGYNPIKEEGIKLISYELFDQLMVAPDVIVVPCGNGTLLYSIYKGFKEIQAGYAHGDFKMPKLIGVQVKGAAPLVAPVKKDPPASIADGIVASESFSLPKVKIALKETGGEIITVTEKEIRNSLKEIIKLESIIPEPTSAAVFAGAKKLSDKDKKRTVVLILSAGGEKNLDQIVQIVD